jgi:hypothetical protein
MVRPCIPVTLPRRRNGPRFEESCGLLLLPCCSYDLLLALGTLQEVPGCGTVC